MLTRYGTDNVIVMCIIGALAIVGACYISRPWIAWPLGVFGGVFILFALWFFRDPERTVHEQALADTSIIVSPCDGHVLEIIEEDEPHYMKEKVKRISIFLSPLDVHVNRIPIGGDVEFYHYNPGLYLVAYHPKSSDKNEQSRIGVKTPYGKIFFKQIVGIVARRLVCELKVGDKVKVGEKFGMMKFGSRMDVMVPLNAQIMVKPGDRVFACETIIAKLKK